MTAPHRDRHRRRLPSKQPASSFALTIDELTLRGFEPSDRHRIGDAVRTELSRLFEGERPEGMAEGGRVDRLNAGSFTMPAGARAETTGINLAGAIHRSVMARAGFGTSSRRGVVARQSDSDPLPPIDRTMEVLPAPLWFNAPAIPECEAGQIYDPNWRKCRPRMCSDFDLEQVRQYVMKKLSETSKWVPPFAAAIRRGRFARFFPAAIEQELTAGAKAVVAKLKAGTIPIVCTEKAVAQTDGRTVKLPLFPAPGSPPWSQTLLGHVTLHECLHLVCSNLPSQPGTDPYGHAADFGGDPSIAMHPDLAPIMTAFPLHLPKW